MKFSYTCLLVLILAFKLSASGLAAPEFENPTESFTESGYIKLSWTWDADAAAGDTYRFELQQDEQSSFAAPREIYQGQDYATFLSGLKNGTYYYRIRAITGASAGEWSAPVLVEVKHHSLSLAFSLFGIGALIFLLTVGIIVQGNRKAAENL